MNHEDKLGWLVLGIGLATNRADALDAAEGCRVVAVRDMATAAKARDSDAFAKACPWPVSHPVVESMVKELQRHVARHKLHAIAIELEAAAKVMDHDEFMTHLRELVA